MASSCTCLGETFQRPSTPRAFRMSRSTCLPAYVWGEATNAKGERRTARVKIKPSRLMGHGMLAGIPGGGEIVIA